MSNLLTRSSWSLLPFINAESDIFSGHLWISGKHELMHMAKALVETVSVCPRRPDQFLQSPTYFRNEKPDTLSLRVGEFRKAALCVTFGLNQNRSKAAGSFRINLMRHMYKVILVDQTVLPVLDVLEPITEEASFRCQLRPHDEISRT